MPNDSIVLYTESMAPRLRDIWNQVIAEGSAYLYDAPAGKAEFTAMLAAQTAVYVGLDEGGQAAGFYILHPNFPGRAAHIANASYAVAKSYRGRGWGRKLAEHSLRAAKKHGFAAMQFNAVVATNTAANQLWHSLGFAEVGQIPAAFTQNDGSRVPLVIYHKAL